MASWKELLPWDLIKETASKFGFEPDLIAAIIMKESGGNSWKVRYESNYRWLYFPRELAEQCSVSLDTMTICQKMSWGIMQVMGAVAYERGFRGDLPQLCQVGTGLYWGCMHLRWLKGKYIGTETDLIASYNHGHPEKTPGGLYVNQIYVDGVSRFLDELRSIA